MINCVINFRKPIRARNPKPYRISVETLLSWHVGHGLGRYGVCRAPCAAVHIHICCIPCVCWCRCRCRWFETTQWRVRSIRASAGDGAKVTVGYGEGAMEQGMTGRVHFALLWMWHFYKQWLDILNMLCSKSNSNAFWFWAERWAKQQKTVTWRNILCTAHIHTHMC